MEKADADIIAFICHCFGQRLWTPKVCSVWRGLPGLEKKIFTKTSFTSYCGPLSKTELSLAALQAEASGVCCNLCFAVSIPRGLIASWRQTKDDAPTRSVPLLPFTLLSSNLMKRSSTGSWKFSHNLGISWSCNNLVSSYFSLTQMCHHTGEKLACKMLSHSQCSFLNQWCTISLKEQAWW